MAHIISAPRFHVPTLSLGHRLGDALQAWRTRLLERRELARFSVRDLQDIGMTPSDQAFQLTKPFWKA